MLISEFSLRNNEPLPDVVLFAGSFLERRGELFGTTFVVHNAVDKASEMITSQLEEDEDWVEFRRQLRSRDIQGDWS
jgi:hypothetical protein